MPIFYISYKKMIYQCNTTGKRNHSNRSCDKLYNILLCLCVYRSTRVYRYSRVAHMGGCNISQPYLGNVGNRIGPENTICYPSSQPNTSQWSHLVWYNEPGDNPNNSPTYIHLSLVCLPSTIYIFYHGNHIDGFSYKPSCQS